MHGCLLTGRYWSQRASAVVECRSWKPVGASEQRKVAKTAVTETAASTFKAVARDWLAVKSHDWVPKNLAKEQLRLEKHAFPWVGDKSIRSLGVADIRPLLNRVSASGHLEQAHRLRVELSRVFQYAIATGHAEADPAHALAAVLPSRQQKGFPSIVMPDEVGALLRAMVGHGGTHVVRCALCLAPYLFCRPGELRTLEWTHIHDLDGEHPECRIVPANRKLKRHQKEAPDAEPHIIPLSRQAVAILRDLHRLTGHRRYVFPGARDPKRCMSEAAVNAALASIGYKGLMVGHGFRHMASTRLEEMKWPDAAIEAQLSHKVPGVRGKYKRDQYLRCLDERRRMMQAWADYLNVLREGQAPEAVGMNTKTA